MKTSQILIGAAYIAKVSGSLVPVKILSTSPYGGWRAVNLATRRDIHVKSPQRLRRLARPEEIP